MGKKDVDVEKIIREMTKNCRGKKR